MKIRKQMPRPRVSIRLIGDMSKLQSALAEFYALIRRRLELEGDFEVLQLCQRIDHAQSAQSLLSKHAFNDQLFLLIDERGQAAEHEIEPLCDMAIRLLLHTKKHRLEVASRL